MTSLACPEQREKRCHDEQRSLGWTGLFFVLRPGHGHRRYRGEHPRSEQDLRDVVSRPQDAQRHQGDDTSPGDYYPSQQRQEHALKGTRTRTVHIHHNW